jgi:hypothetical protein
MSIRRLSVLSLAVLALWPLAAEAQVINRPQRAYRGLFGGGRPQDPNRSRQELTFTFNALGGYDDNAAAGEGIGVPSTALTPDGAGYTGNFDAALAYFVGTTAKSFALDFGVGTSAYHNVDLDPSQSYTLNATGRTTLGARTSISASENLSYSSQLRLDAPLTDGIPIGDVPTDDSAIFGLGPRASVNSTTSAGLEQQITRDAALTGTYGYTTTAFTEGDTGGYRSHRASARYSHRVGRWTEATGTYEYNTTRYGFGVGDEGRPMTQNRISGGLSWERRLSPRRTMTVTAQGGAFNLESVTGLTLQPYALWAPFVEFSTQLDIGRDWNLGGNYRRGADTLEGLTTEAFINDNATFTLSGLATRRIDLAFIGGVARGTSAAEGGLNSKYLTTTGSAQARIAISRMLSAVVSYHYYHYDFDETVLPVGVAPTFGRNAVRVGIAVWLPLYGSYSRQ